MEQWINVTMLFILGSAVGSFLNVLIDRLPKGKKITGRSVCDNCKKKIGSRDLIPIFSYFFLKGRCRYCEEKISFYYPFVEALTGILFVVGWSFLPAPTLLHQVSYLGIIACLITIFFTDVKYMVIPDEILVAMALFSLPFALFGEAGRALFNHILAAFLLSSFFFFLYHVTKGKAMGFGDVKLSFVIGLFQGLKIGFFSVYLAFVIGGIVGIILLFLKAKGMKSKIAFGPFLVVGVFVTLFFERQVIEFFEKVLAFYR